MQVSITIGSTTQEATLENLLQYAPHLDKPGGTKETVEKAIIALFREALEEEWERTRDQVMQTTKLMGWGLTP